MKKIIALLVCTVVSCGHDFGDPVDPFEDDAKSVVIYGGFYKTASSPSIVRFNTIGRVCNVTDEEWQVLASQGKANVTTISSADMFQLLATHPPVGLTCSYEEATITNRVWDFTWGPVRAYGTTALWTKEKGNPLRTCWLTYEQWTALGFPGYQPLTQQQTVDYMTAFHPRSPGANICTNAAAGVP